jgi:CubicO group peptidase (beta-lactamase class C family)
MSDLQQHVQAILDDHIAREVETGLQVAAYWRGELIVDAWAGASNSATGRLVDGNTLFTTFSCTKGVMATAIHLLAERGLIDYDAPIARYWPEFSANGKARITVRQALTHSSAIPQMPEGCTPEAMCDWEYMCRAIADSEPLWEPGTRTGYHAFNLGWILGETARRADGRPLERIIREDLCQPLGISDLYLGIPDEVEERVATLVEDEKLTNSPSPEPGSLFARVFPSTLGSFDATFNRADVRRAVIPAAGGIMSARALARLYAALVGFVDGVRLLPEERMRIATTPHTGEVDLVLGQAIIRAMGYALGRPSSPMSARITVFGHGGLGGSSGFADPEYHFAFALLKSRLCVPTPGEDVADLVAREIRADLGIPEAN